MTQYTLNTLLHGITCSVAILCLLSITEYASKAVKHLRDIRNSASELEAIAQCDHQDKWSRRACRGKNARGQ